MSTTVTTKEILRRGVRVGHRVQAAAQVAKIKPPMGTSSTVVAALRASLVSRPSPQEQEWIQRVEAQRHAMATSAQPLEYNDFGSGDDTDYVSGSEPFRRRVTLGELTRRSSASPRWGYLLFRLVRALKPTSVLELGTCVGVSAAYIGAALELNDRGRLTTLEGGEAPAERSRHTLAELGLRHRVEVVHGAFAETLEDVLGRVRPLQLAFIDGHHQELPTVRYTGQIRPHLSPDAVLAFDDINWSKGMRRAWETITASPDYAMSLDLGRMGLAVLGGQGAESPVRAAIHYA
jgi:predicted O-methyltransferase YrrM